MNPPHKHAALIKAWADGAEIELYFDKKWIPANHPAWAETSTYRIKPEPPEEPNYGEIARRAWYTDPSGTGFSAWTFSAEAAIAAYLEYQKALKEFKGE
jgi:hypothetical protein